VLFYIHAQSVDAHRLLPLPNKLQSLNGLFRNATQLIKHEIKTRQKHRYECDREMIRGMLATLMVPHDPTRLIYQSWIDTVEPKFRKALYVI
jgi:hypothetical protein